MASRRGARGITAEQVEDMKGRHGFDLDLARAIMPVKHPRRRRLEDPVLNQDFVEVIRQRIDIHFGPFIASGARKVPRVVYKKRPPRRSRPFSPGPELE